MRQLLARLHDGRVAHGRAGVWPDLLGGDVSRAARHRGREVGLLLLVLLLEWRLYPHRSGRPDGRLTDPVHRGHSGLRRQHADLRLAVHAGGGLRDQGLRDRPDLGLEWKAGRISTIIHFGIAGQLTGICVRGEPEKATLAEGGLMPSIVISFVTSDWRNRGRLFCKKERNSS